MIVFRRPSVRFRRGAAALGALAALGLAAAVPSVAGAQASAGAVVRVTVTDSAARPLAGVAVLVMRGLTEVTRRTTDERGAATAALAGDSAVHEVVARLIGHQRTSRFVRLAAGDTTHVALVLRPLAQRLDAVRVTAREATRRRNYFIDADGIAASERPIRSALDVLTTLRPTMLTSLAGWRVCGVLQHVWVNGRRIPDAIIADERLKTRMLPGVPPKQRVPLEVLTVLDEIRPEHIQEITYADCFDGRVARPHATNAVFVTLKPGIVYEIGRGTRVADPLDPE